MNGDWRLTNQINYLYMLKLKKKHLKKLTEATMNIVNFALENLAKIRETYILVIASLDRYHWICDRCFGDFKDLFKWTLE